MDLLLRIRSKVYMRHTERCGSGLRLCDEMGREIWRCRKRSLPVIENEWNVATARELAGAIAAAGRYAATSSVRRSPR